ncbi:Integrin beta-like protein 1, partial [Plecturocebus cupreus]
MTEEQSKNLCESADGILCSGKGSCHCGKCICSAEEWYISGEFCDCDDRDCDKHDGLICTVCYRAKGHSSCNALGGRTKRANCEYEVTTKGEGMEYVTVETVNAGMDGMEMHVKSGLAQNILNNYMR